MRVNKKKTRTDRIVNLAVSVDNRVKLKENEKCDKNLDLAEAQKSTWNMKMTVIFIVIGALDTIT